MKETDLYVPVKDLLSNLGYLAKAEVDHIDIVALKQTEWIAVELKTSFTLKLILQAVQRQKLTKKVFVALPAPTGRQRFSKKFKEYEHLLRRLELGLILVYFKDIPRAEIIFEPKEYSRDNLISRNRKKSAAVLQEAKGRRNDCNIGGSNGKVMTVYREQALLAASFLFDNGESSVKVLRELTGNPKVQTLLLANHYGWFERTGRGVYTLSAEGKEALKTYCEIVENLRHDSTTVSKDE